MKLRTAREAVARAALIVGAVLIAAPSACGLNLPSSGSKASPPSAPTPLSTQGLKPVITGLISEAGPPPPRFRAYVHAFVVDAKWSQLQSSPGAPITNDNPIDQAIATARQLNLAVKVRLLTGIDAPEWAKHLGGSPITVTAPVDHITGTIGRFWTSQYGNAYDDLQAKLAAKYDSVPQIREVTVARCMTIYDEPFIRDAADPKSAHALLQAGFTVSADTSCQKSEIDAANAWTTTRIGVAFSTYERINPDGSYTKDANFTESMMRYCRERLGLRCVLENNGITAHSPLSSVYRTIRELGPPVSFQLAGLRKVRNIGQALSLAASLHATSVEVLPNLLANVPAPSQADGQMQANARLPGGS